MDTANGSPIYKGLGIWIPKWDFWFFRNWNSIPLYSCVWSEKEIEYSWNSQIKGIY